MRHSEEQSTGRNIRRLKDSEKSPYIGNCSWFSNEESLKNSRMAVLASYPDRKYQR